MKHLDETSMSARYFSHYLTVVLLIVWTLSCRIPAAFSATENEVNEEQPGQESPVTVEEQEDFEYTMDNRPDPFRPFIEEKVATKLDPDEIIDKDVKLTGMQLFEPGQLRLVAVMFAGDRKIAFVEDVTGQGYAIKEGTLIGRHGVVSGIGRDQVTITETAQTRAGKEIITTIVMRLNKEGDQ